jgi:hypothetical protein
MLIRSFVTSLFVLLLCDTLEAQKIKSDSVVHFTSAQIDSMAHLIPGSEKPSRLLATSKEKESYLIVVRTKEGAAEIHEQFDDVAIIRGGAGVLRTGFDLKGGKVTGANGKREWLGGDIAKPNERSIKTGDFLVIPAMLAHQFIPAAGDSLIYYVIKVKHPSR